MSTRMVPCHDPEFCRAVQMLIDSASAVGFSPTAVVRLIFDTYIAPDMTFEQFGDLLIVLIENLETNSQIPDLN